MSDSEGQSLSLEDYQGKVVLIDFSLAGACPAASKCPHVVELYQQHKEDGFAVIGINFDNTREEYDAYRKEAGITWQNYFDGKGWATS